MLKKETKNAKNQLFRKLPRQPQIKPKENTEKEMKKLMNLKTNTLRDGLQDTSHRFKRQSQLTISKMCDEKINKKHKFPASGMKRGYCYMCYSHLKDNTKKICINLKKS
jgi:hypothetical protein